MQNPQPETTPDVTPRGLSRRSVATAAAWSMPVIVASTVTPAFAASVDPNGPVFIPSTLNGVVGGGWSIAAAFNAKGLPSVARAARSTATAVPITVSPAKATSVTLSLSGAGFSFYTVANNTNFTPTQSITVTTSAQGQATVYVAVPPYGMGADSATVTATANGTSAVATLTTRVGYAYTIGGHTPEGQTGNGALLNATAYPTPWALTEPLAGIYASLSSIMGITKTGQVRSGGYNPYGEVGTAGNEGVVADLVTPMKADGSVFTDATRAIVAQSGSEQGLFVVEDSKGDWWAVGEQGSNYLAIAGDTGSYRLIKRWEKVGGLLPTKPVWLSYNRNNEVLVWTLADGTVWFTGNAAYMSNYSKAFTTTTGKGIIQQLRYADGTAVTGVKKALQTNDNTVIMLTTDGRLLYSSSEAKTLLPADYPNDRQVHEIAAPAGTIAELWARQPYENTGNSYFVKTTDNTLWALGGNSRGVLGIGSDVPAVTTWTKVLVEDVKEISMGAQSLLILDNSGAVWWAGLNDENNWGLGTSGPATVSTPVKVTTLPPNVKTIATTWWDASLAAY